MERYPTVACLADAYLAADSRQQGERLLADVPVLLAHGGTQRFGPVLSKKLHTAFTSFDPSTRLADGDGDSDGDG